MVTVHYPRFQFSHCVPAGRHQACETCSLAKKPRDKRDGRALRQVAMQQTAVDPSTGTIDMDLIQTGISASDRRLNEDLAVELGRFLQGAHCPSRAQTAVLHCRTLHPAAEASPCRDSCRAWTNCSRGDACQGWMTSSCLRAPCHAERHSDSAVGCAENLSGPNARMTRAALVAGFNRQTTKPVTEVQITDALALPALTARFILDGGDVRLAQAH